MRRWLIGALASLATLATAPSAPILAQQATPAGNWLTYQHDAARSGQADGSFPNPASASVLWESKDAGPAKLEQVAVHLRTTR